MELVSHKIEEMIDGGYTKNEYPALAYQKESWGVSRPLKGLSILDATPVFRNTMVKYLALIAAGAKLSVGLSDVMPFTPAIVEFLESIGVNVVYANQKDPGFDIILDCAGSFSHFDPRLGYVELTRSGVERYADSKKAVFVADSGRIKRIETLLGTGESLFRALDSLGYNSWRGKKIVLFGSGKVGSGIIIYGHSLGACMSVITDLGSLSESIAARCCKAVDYRDAAACVEAVKDADLIVTATGFKDAIIDRYVVDAIINSSALLANMGVEDEFGEAIPADRVLNHKKPLNFILDEPTHLKYIETTMALHNAGALYIACNPNVVGIIDPPRDIEEQLLDITSRNGVIGQQLTLIE